MRRRALEGVAGALAAALFPFASIAVSLADGIDRGCRAEWGGDYGYETILYCIRR